MIFSLVGFFQVVGNFLVAQCAQQLADVARLSVEVVGYCAYVHAVRVIAQ